MRLIFAFVLSIWAGISAAQGADIQRVINAQIAAFGAGDFEEAFGYASPGIQDIFDNPDRFGAMVRQGYPMVIAPENLRYMELREISGQLWQRVFIRDQSGAGHLLDYQMIEVEGHWRINGVQLLPTPDVSA